MKPCLQKQGKPLYGELGRMLVNPSVLLVSLSKLRGEGYEGKRRQELGCEREKRKCLPKGTQEK